MEEFDEVEFSRFPADKQEQVRQLVQFTTLMGLTGKDLISIGGSLERRKKTRERKANQETLKQFDCLLVGDDKKWESDKWQKERRLDDRFRLVIRDRTYTFSHESWTEWSIVSKKTKKKVVHDVSPNLYEYALPRSSEWRREYRLILLMNIATGKLKLDF